MTLEKKLGQFILVVMMASLLGACGGKDGGGSSAVPTGPKQPSPSPSKPPAPTPPDPSVPVSQEQGKAATGLPSPQPETSIQTPPALPSLNGNSAARRDLSGRLTPNELEPDDIEFEGTEHDYKFNVADAEKLKILLMRTRHFAVAGQIVDLSNKKSITPELYPKTICAVQAAKTTSLRDSDLTRKPLIVKSFAYGSQVREQKHGRSLTLFFEDSAIYMVCSKPNDGGPFTWTEMQTAFGDILELEPL